MIPWLFVGCVPTPPATVVAPSPAAAICTDVADAPLAMSTLTGFSGGEDFAFDAEGAVVSVDPLGRLTRQTRDGDIAVVRAGLELTSGLVVVPGGDIVVAEVLAGTVLRIGADGGTEVLASGLAYPNGVALHDGTHVLVSDQSRGELLRIQLSDGAREVLVSGLDQPNGVAVGGDGSLYVTSFGGGTVTRVVQQGDGWAAEPFGDVEIALPTTPCDADGQSCMIGPSLGVCTGERCEPVRDEAACAAAISGDPCSTERLGVAVDSRCIGEPLFCPFTPTGLLEACDEAVPFDSCVVGAGTGACEVGAQGLLACRVAADQRCDVLGDECVVDDEVLPYLGTCLDFGGLGSCRPADLDPIGGGLDGVSVGPCGWVYATEFRTGVLHRWPTDGGRSQPAAVLPSEWIPNLSWGTGRGGFSVDRLYVMDRGEGRLFELEPLQP